MPIVERLARLQEPDLPEKGVRYTRRVTQIWCGFFIINGGIALFTALYGDMSLWTAWNGMIAYFLMGTLMAGEWPAGAPSGDKEIAHEADLTACTLADCATP